MLSISKVIYSKKCFTLLAMSLSLFFSVPIAADSNNCIPSNDCSGKSISDNCDQSCTVCSTNDLSTFFRPRTITTDLTYRDCMTFYQRYHEGSCSFFYFDSAFIYQQNRHAPCIGLGFLGKQPLIVASLGKKQPPTVAQQNSDVNALNLSLANRFGGFSSEVTLSPKRKVFAWLPQFVFNLDCVCPGLWFDLAFAVVHARHEVCLDEKVATKGALDNLENVQQAFTALHIFPDTIRHTGVDDIEVRIGYDVLYCDSEHIGLYLLGSIPTGKHFDNSIWFQPLVGSRHGGIGFGFTADHALWDDDLTNTECMLMTELKYQFKFPADERRMFDLDNGPLSRFLLVAPENNRLLPRSATTLLRKCVKVEPRHTFDWWIALNYHVCNWGFEAGYNLFWRDEERLCVPPFDFGNFGIFDMTRCVNQTSHSQARISDEFGEGKPDATFVFLDSTDVNTNSAKARKAISHTFSGAIHYNDCWCDHAWMIGIGARYELASKHHRFSTLENWGVFGKFSLTI